MFAKKKKDSIILKPKLKMGDEFRIRFKTRKEVEAFMQDIIDAKTNKVVKRFERHNCMIRQRGNELTIKFIETNRHDKVYCVIRFSKDEIGKDKSSLINVVFGELAQELTGSLADLIIGFAEGDETENSAAEEQQVDKKHIKIVRKKEEGFTEPNKIMTREESRQLRREAEREKERERNRAFEKEMESFLRDDPFQDAIDWVVERNNANKNNTDFEL